MCVYVHRKKEYVHGMSLILRVIRLVECKQQKKNPIQCVCMSVSVKLNNMKHTKWHWKTRKAFTIQKNTETNSTKINGDGSNKGHTHKKEEVWYCLLHKIFVRSFFSGYVCMCMCVFLYLRHFLLNDWYNGVALFNQYRWMKATIQKQFLRIYKADEEVPVSSWMCVYTCVCMSVKEIFDMKEVRKNWMTWKDSKQYKFWITMYSSCAPTWS